jgi:hypothetical protein
VFAIALGPPGGGRAIALSSAFEDLGSMLTQGFNRNFTSVLLNGQASVQTIEL